MFVMNFLADMGVSLKVVEWLRSQEHNVKHLREQGLQKLGDQDIFELARREDRILLTFDLDFGEIIAFANTPVVNTVIFRLSNAKSSVVIQRLQKTLLVLEEKLNESVIILVEDGRIRVRKLPI